MWKLGLKLIGSPCDGALKVVFGQGLTISYGKRRLSTGMDELGTGQEGVK